MFEHTEAFSGFSVDDIPKAKEFYGEMLGIGCQRSTGCSICTSPATGTR